MNNIKHLCEHANSINTCPNIEWEDSTYHNDACPSISAYIDADQEWYVQLFEFESKEAANAEEFDFVYATRIVKDGQDDWHGDYVWSGDDRVAALLIAVAAAERLQKQHLVHCQQERIEYEGIVIEDTSLSPCGRFELTPEQQREMYGHFDADELCRNGKPIATCQCC